MIKLGLRHPRKKQQRKPHLRSSRIQSKPLSLQTWMDPLKFQTIIVEQKRVRKIRVEIRRGHEWSAEDFFESVREINVFGIVVIVIVNHHSARACLSMQRRHSRVHWSPRWYHQSKKMDNEPKDQEALDMMLLCDDFNVGFVTVSMLVSFWSL